MKINRKNEKIIEALRARGMKNLDRILNEFLTDILTEIETLTNSGDASEPGQSNIIEPETPGRQFEREERCESPEDTPPRSC